MESDNTQDIENKKELLKEEIKEQEQRIDEDIKETKDKEKIKEFKEEKEELKDIKKEKNIKKAEKKLDSLEQDIDETEDEISFDFSKITNFFKKSKKEDKKESRSEKETNKENTKNSSDEEVSLNFGDIASFWNSHKRWLIPTLLIFLAIGFSTYFRMYPADLPITDDWAENTVNNYYKNQIKSQINQQYPNLPAANKNTLINNQFNEFLKNNKEQYKAQIEATSKQYKSNLQYTGTDGEEHTYLLAIDPYLWYGQGKNYLECGNAGCDLKEDGNYYTYRNGRYGLTSGMNLVSYIGLLIYKIGNVIGNLSLMHAFFLIPVILIGLSIIPAFFIAKKLGGNIGGFFAAMIIALNSALLGRTPAGFSDTDAANIIFPLFIMWFFLEAFYSDSWKKITIYSVLGGIGFYLYAKMWNIEHLFDFLVAAVGVYIIISLVNNIIKNKKLNFRDFLLDIKEPVGKSGIFVFFSLLFIVFTTSLDFIPRLVTNVLNFAKMKEVAVAKIWPNVLTTVAEFNTVPLTKIIDQMGGSLLFAFALLGILFSALKKDKKGRHYILYSSLIIIWFVGTAYAFTKGMRFSLLMVPAFAVAFGIGVGVSYEYISKKLSSGLKINKNIVSVVFIILFSLLLISPLNSAHKVALSEIPSYNDAWDESLDEIKQDAEDGIGYITTWWDFGHWFVANDIRVTFDGGDQGERIHWVGKSLLTDDEDLSIGILRMLNCGQENAPHILECHLKGSDWEWENEIAGKGECAERVENKYTVQAIEILDEILVQDKEKAAETLEAYGLDDRDIEETLKVTHCNDILPQYYITSEDMVGKARVWGHFGSWDFKRARMYQKAKNMNTVEGVGCLMDEFNLSETEADNIYYEIQNKDADRWISPWPGYLSGISSCDIQENMLVCGNGVIINTTNTKTYFSNNQGTVALKSLAYIDDNGEFKVKKFEGQTAPYSAALLPDGKAILMDPLLAGSMFTRLFYYEGHGLKHFDKFSEKTQVTGGRIKVWNVDFEGNEAIDIFSEENEPVEIKESVSSENLNNNMSEDEEELMKHRNLR